MTGLKNNANGRDKAANGHSYEVFGWYRGGKDEPKTVNSVLTYDVQTTYRGMQGTGAIENHPDDKWDNHGGDGGNVAFCDGHAQFVRHV